MQMKICPALTVPPLQKMGPHKSPIEVAIETAKKLTAAVKYKSKSIVIFVSTKLRALARALDEGAQIHNRQKRMAEEHFRSNAFFLRTIY